MIPRLRPVLGPSEFLAAMRSRPVADFETRFAELMGQAHALAFPYGRTGLLLLLEALGLKNNEIICPAYSCVVVAHAIVLSGNRPVFIDSEADGFNMDLEAAAKAVEIGAKALIATSIHGYPVDLDKLDWMRKRWPDLIIIQDCAHSFSAQWQGRPVQQAGQAAFFGLNVSKLMTSIFGGVVTTDDSSLADRLRELRDQRLKPASFKAWQRRAYLTASATALHPRMFGFVHKFMKLGLIDRFTEYYDEASIDMPDDYLSVMSPIEAAVGLVQCDRYPSIIAHRRHIASVYDKALASLPGLRRPPLAEGATYAHYVCCVAEPNELIQEMARDGIELGRLIDYCIPDMPAYQSYVPLSSEFTRTRALNSQVINLPLHLSEQEALYVVERLHCHMRAKCS